MRAGRIIPLALIALLGGCDERTDAQRAAAEAGRPVPFDDPEHVGTSGPFEIYRVRVVSRAGNTYLWVVPGATTYASCGKNCTRGVASPAPQDQPTIALPVPANRVTPVMIEALQRLDEPQRRALGLPDPTDPRLTGLAKLTPEERAALGLTGVVPN